MQETLATIRAKIEKARENSPLQNGPVTLLGACKGQSVAAIEDAIAQGLTDFGENRVQEAHDKWPAIRDAHPNVRLHLIGPLQTNKVKQALSLFDVIQTIDRAKLADAIAKELQQSDHPIIRSSGHRFFIQVNTGKEPQKAGVIPEEAAALIAHCQQLGLPIAGLMCVPPAGQPPAPHFALLHQMAKTHGMRELSMGMSEDFEVAVRMGATCVRLGRVLFGERPHG